MEFRVTRAGKDDVELLVKHRLDMWRDMHPEWGEKVQESEGVTRGWIRRKMSEGKLVGFVVRTRGGKVAGSGCIWLKEEQPRPTSPFLEAPNLMSMYTEKEFRRRGVASVIVKSALAWCREHSYDRVVARASEGAKPLYESFGFKPTNEMRLDL